MSLRLNGDHSIQLAGLLLGALLVLAACRGEDRPAVDVIKDASGNPTGNVSVSASDLGPVGPAQDPSLVYKPASNVDVDFKIGPDLRDIRGQMAAAGEGKKIDWAAVTAIFENGKNQTRPEGGLRSLASLADGAKPAFPNGQTVYGRANFVDGGVRDGLTGAGRGAGLSDNARRNLVDKGLLTIVYGRTLQSMAEAKTQLAAGNRDNNTGAPHLVDQAFATATGAPDGSGLYSYSLLGTASAREAQYKLEGKIRNPLEAAFTNAQKAAQAGDVAAFDKANADVKGYTNAIFYLSTLRYGQEIAKDTTPADRQAHLAEAWAFWQSIRAAVAAASPAAAQKVEAAYTRSPDQAFPASLTTEIYAALNDPAVLSALGIPDSVQVKTPPKD